MITIHCELTDTSLYPIVDDAFVVSAGMKKIGIGQYEGTGNVINTSFFAIKDLFKNEDFVKSIKVFTRTVDGEEEDLLEFYEYLKRRGRI